MDWKLQTDVKTDSSIHGFRNNCLRYNRSEVLSDPVNIPEVFLKKIATLI